MPNADLRTFILNSGLRMYEVAEILGIADTSLSRKLRKELKATEKIEILNKIKAGGKDADRT